MTTRLIERLETHAAKLAWLGGALFLALGLFLSRGGMLHPEAESFLPHYLDSSRPLASLVLDPKANDFGMYQARELSYLFDWLDCRFLSFCAARGAPHFLALSHFVFAIVGAALLWSLTAKLALSRALRAVLVLLYLSTPMVLLGGDFFRSAKAGAALAILAGLRFYAGLVRPSSDRRAARFLNLAGLGCAALIAGLFDRQGVFLVLVGCLLHGLRCLARPARREFAILAVLAGAALLLFANNHVLAPALIEWTNDYRPTRDFQRFLPGTLSEWRAASALLLFHGPVVALKYIGAALGSLPWPLVGLAVLGHASFVLRHASPALCPRERMLALWPIWLTFSLMTMTALMVLRISSLMLPEFCLHYYSLPTAAACCAALSALLSGRSDHRRRIALGLGLVLVTANLLQLHDHRQRLHRGYYAAAYDRAPHLLTALRAASPGTGAEKTRAVLAALPPDTGPAATAAVLALINDGTDPSSP